MRSQPEYRELLAIAGRAADAAAAVIREAAPRVRSIDWRAKSPTDFVSEVDIAAEAAIVEVFSAELPEAAILAEESASAAPRARLAKGLTVVADPLDGTTNFLHGFPMFAVSIAVLKDGAPVAAIVLEVPGDERFTATLGGGCFVGAVPCRVSPITDPQRALIGTGFPFKEVADIPTYADQMARVMAGAGGVRRPGAASIDLVSVAAGRFEAFWEGMLSPWDFAAGMLLVTEAGGVVSTVEGGRLDPLVSSSILAGSPAMHAWLGKTVCGET